MRDGNAVDALTPILCWLDDRDRQPDEPYGNGTISAKSCCVPTDCSSACQAFSTVEFKDAIVNLDAQRCTQLTLQLAEPVQPVNLAQLESDDDRLLPRYYNLNLAQVNFSQRFYDILQRALANHLRVLGNMGLYAKTLANLKSVAHKLDSDFDLSNQIKPLMTDLFRRQLVGGAPLQALLRTALDLKTLSL
ncbi:MAG: hypothetical protein KME45_13350 [Stenomitos rutilans HA7619-LM2]|nr:hypothetical protein [Stenomitos rutilans HA7619-LM2]